MVFEPLFEYWSCVLEIDFLLALQGVRESAPDAVNQFFLVLSSFVVGPLPVLVTALVFWCVNKRAGYFMASGYLACSCVNQLVKNIACINRPWILDARVVPDAAAMPEATGYSFPSGHTACATGFFGSIALWLRSHKLVVALCLVLIALSGFSRMWLGCHCPKDVVVAWLLSAAVLAGMYWAAKLVHRHPSWDIPLAVAVFALSALALVFLELKPYPLEYAADGSLLVDPFAMKTDCFKNMGGLMAMSIAWPLERRLIRFSEGGSLPVRIARGAVGALLVAVLYMWLFPVLLKPLLGVQVYAFLRYFVLIIMLVAVYPACFKAVEQRFCKKSA